MRLINTALILILLTSCGNTKKYKLPKTDFFHIESDKWIMFNSKQYIPEALSTHLNSLGISRSDIANPDEEYEATDLILNDNLPYRQLQFLAKADSFWIMTYQHGGFASHCHLVLSTIIN